MLVQISRIPQFPFKIVQVVCKHFQDLAMVVADRRKTLDNLIKTRAEKKIKELQDPLRSAGDFVSSVSPMAFT